MPDITIDRDKRLPEGFQFTQSKLQDFLDCPRRFYLKYIEGQRWPAPVTEPQELFEAKSARGKQMHQIIEQHLLGIPLQAVEQQIAEGDAILQDWFAEYQTQYKAIADMPRRYAEISLSTTLQDHPLLAKFDALLIDDQHNVTAIDWKTGPLPKPEQLEKRMQTVLYLVVLYHASAAVAGQQPNSYTLQYISLETGETQRFTVNAHSVYNLEMQLLDVIQLILSSNFDKAESELPCRFCVYRGLCARGTAIAALDSDAVQELLDTGDEFDWFDDIDSHTVEF